MRLSELAIQRITDSKSLPKKLRATLGITRQTMAKYLKENNDFLTKASAIKIIREETGLTDDQILEESTADVERV